MRYGLKSENRNSAKGFTLVELLIVVAIIGVLATLLMANFIAVRERARDAQRKSDLRQIQSALEIYRSDNSSYPTTLYSANCPNPSALTGGSPVNTYMAVIPCDPSGVSYYNIGKYVYSSDGTTYKLGACLENASDTQQGTTSTAPTGGTGVCSTNWYFVVTQP